MVQNGMVETRGNHGNGRRTGHWLWQKRATAGTEQAGEEGSSRGSRRQQDAA